MNPNLTTEELLTEPTEIEKAELAEIVNALPGLAHVKKTLRRVFLTLDKYKAYHDITTREAGR